MAIDKKVIDISTFNSVASYSQIVNNTDGTIIRVGYRGYGSSGSLVTDNKFSTYYSNLKSAKSNYPVGVYWVTQAISDSEAIEEANYVYNLIRNKDIFFPVYLDSEYGSSSHNGRADTISQSRRTQYAISFCQRIKELGYKSGIYASDSWFVNQLNYSTLKSSGSVDSFWVAKYSSNKPSYVTTYDAWQYTSSASISGISGSCDCSHFYKWWGSEPTPTPEIDISTKHMILDPTSFTYDGTNLKPSVTIEGVATKNYSVSYSNNRNVGTGRVTATGKNNYTGTLSETFRIYPVSMRDESRITISLSQTRYSYDGTPKTPSVTVVDRKTGVLVEGTDYTVSYGANIMPGNAIVQVIGRGNYSNAIETSFVIEAKALTGTIQFDSGSNLYKYTGSAITPAVHIDGLTQGVDYTIGYSNNINCGSNAKVYCYGTGGYTGTLEATFMISRCEMAYCTIYTNPTSYTYDGKEKVPAVTIKDNDINKVISPSSYTLTFTNNINAGTAYIKATGTGQYNGYNSTKFTIYPKSIIGTEYVAEDTNFYFNNKPHMANITVYGLNYLTDYKLDASNTVNVGEGGISIIGINNYTDSILVPTYTHYQPIQDCIAKFGYATLWSEYRVYDEKGLQIYTPDNQYKLVENTDFIIINQDKKAMDGFYLYYFEVKGLTGFSGTAEYYFRIIDSDPIPSPEELEDDLVWNFGNLDYEEYDDDPETAEGDYDFGPLE